MPQLTLVNNLSSNYHPRTRIVVVDENFSSTSGGFVEVNTSQIIASKRLKINATATEGYSKNNWAISPGTSYTFTIDYVFIGSGAEGAGVIKLGSTLNGTQYMEEGVQDANSTETVTFISTGTRIYLSLVTNENETFCTWDNLKIEEVP